MEQRVHRAVFEAQRALAARAQPLAQLVPIARLLEEQMQHEEAERSLFELAHASTSLP